MIRWLHRYRNEPWVWLLFSQYTFEMAVGADLAQSGRRHKFLREHLARFNKPRRAF